MLKLNFEPFPILTTERLVLRALELADDVDIFAHRNDDTVNTYLDDFRHFSIEDTRTFIVRVTKEIIEGRTILWVLNAKGSNKFMGTVCFWNISKENLKAELGYTICTEYQNQGFMGEALRRILDFGYNEIGIRNVEAHTHKDNLPSIKLLTANQLQLDKNIVLPNNRARFSFTREN